MNKYLTTDWFVNGETPWEPGVYNVSCRKSSQSGKWYAKFDGSTWFCATRTRHAAQEVMRTTSTADYWHREGSWRGLASDPKAKP